MNEAERQKFEEIMMAFVRIGRDGSVPVDVRNFATEWRDKVQAYIAARASEASPPQPEPLRKALEAIANDPIIGKETLDPAAMWYRSIAANALSGAAATAPSAPTATDLQKKQLDAEQAWEYLQSKGVPNLDIERPGKDKVTLVELLAEFGNGVYIGRDEPTATDWMRQGVEAMFREAGVTPKLSTIERCVDILAEYAGEHAGADQEKQT